MKNKGMIHQLWPIWAFLGMMVSSASSVAASSTVDWDHMLTQSGVSDVLDQANLLIEQELKILEKTPIPLSSKEISTVSSSFVKRLNSKTLKQNVIAQLQDSLSSDNINQIQDLLSSPELREVLLIQSSVNNSNVRKSMRSYLMDMQKKPVNIKRLELVSNLDESLQQSALESELKVELRKQLLAMVAQLKINDTIPEDMLDRQLTAYRDRVEKDTSQNAKNAYIYLLKGTSSKDIQVLHEELSHPAFYHFMAICLQSIRDSFYSARQDFRARLQLAEG